MRTITILFFLAIYNFTFLNAQTLFQKKYLVNYANSQIIQNSEMNDDSYFLTSNADSKITLGKIDSNGDLIWAKVFGNDSMRNFPISLIVLQNDDIIAGTYSDDGGFGSTIKSNVLKFDKFGNNIFIKKYSQAGVSDLNALNQLIKDESGFTAVVNDFNSFNSKIIRMDANGNWIKTAVLPNNLAKIYKSSDKNYFVYNLGLATMVKYDSLWGFHAANFFSLNPSPETQHQILELADSSFLVCGGNSFGGCQIDRFDKNLNSLWRGYYGYQNIEIGQAVSMAQIDSNKIVVLTGFDDPGFGYRPTVFTIDLAGSVINAKIFKNNSISTNYLPTQTQAKNGTFTFLNNELLPGNQFTTYFNIYKTDTALNTMCNYNDTTPNFTIEPPELQTATSYSVSLSQDSLVNDIMPVQNYSFIYGECSDTTLSLSYTNAELRLRVYPNPIVNNLLIIDYHLNSINEGRFELFDLTGKVIFQMLLPVGSSSQKIVLPKLSNGVYSGMITNGFNRTTKKVIVFNE